MGPCILILSGHLNRTDWLLQRATTARAQVEVEETALYSARQIVEFVERASREHPTASDILVLEAHMATGEIYRAVDELKLASRPHSVPVLVVGAAPDGPDRIVRGYVYGVASETCEDVPLQRFSRRIVAPVAGA